MLTVVTMCLCTVCLSRSACLCLSLTLFSSLFSLFLALSLTPFLYPSMSAIVSKAMCCVGLLNLWCYSFLSMDGHEYLIKCEKDRETMWMEGERETQCYRVIEREWKSQSQLYRERERKRETSERKVRDTLREERKMEIINTNKNIMGERQRGRRGKRRGGKEHQSTVCGWEREYGGEGNSSGIPTSVLLWNTDVFVRQA